MNTSLILNIINQILEEINKSKIIKNTKKSKYSKDLKSIYKEYEEIEIKDNLKVQYNQLNSKGKELIKELKNFKPKKKNNLEYSIETYVRYLKASMYDFKEKNIYLTKYITSFLFCSILFLALSPQFYGFVLPILFFLPIYMGLKGVKQRSIIGFYMTMSVVPVAIMTAVTWIRYGLNSISDYNNAVMAIVNDGISQELAQALVYIGPIFGIILLIFAFLQLYRGIKTRDLFI